MLKEKWFRITLIAAATLVVLLLTFDFGLYIGEKKENFNHRWAENYGRLFGEPRPGFFPPPSDASPAGAEMRAFGNGGVVLKVGSDTLAIEGNNNNEKVIAVASSTAIRKLTSDIKLGDINPGDMVVVIGNPDSSGQIQAQFIRVFPPQNSLNGQSPANR